MKKIELVEILRWLLITPLILSKSPHTKYPTSIHLYARDITSTSWQKNLDLTHSLGTTLHTIPGWYTVISARIHISLVTTFAKMFHYRRQHDVIVEMAGSSWRHSRRSLFSEKIENYEITLPSQIIKILNSSSRSYKKN